MNGGSTAVVLHRRPFLLLLIFYVGFCGFSLFLFILTEPYSMFGLR